MAVGPRDYIDQLLVKKYADENDAKSAVITFDRRPMKTCLSGGIRRFFAS